MTLVEVVFLVIFWAWVLTALLFLRQTFLPRLPLQRIPAAFTLPAETVQFRATDGITLEGWKIVANPSKPWLILCHGLGTNRADLLQVAVGLHQARFNLLLFDFRGHGGSAGRTTSFGFRERHDLEGALTFLGQQTDIPAKGYGVYGISMGAAVALMTAATDERLAAVAVESPYPTLEETLNRHLALIYRMLPPQPFRWFVLLTYRMRFGIWPRHVSPVEHVARLSPRPLLLVTGAEDVRMPIEGTKRLFAAAGTPKELWIIEGAGHLEGFAVDPPRYIARLRDFFDAYLSK